MNRKLITLPVALLAAVALAAPASSQANPVSRAQATATAKDYLRSSAFSRKGLIEQLRFEGFSGYDAVWGTDHSGANWYRQAVLEAKGYLRSSHFSHSGLVEQLEFEGFSAAQAQYGVRGVGL